MRKRWMSSWQRSSKRIIFFISLRYTLIAIAPLKFMSRQIFVMQCSITSSWVFSCIVGSHTDLQQFNWNGFSVAVDSLALFTFLDSALFILSCHATSSLLPAFVVFTSTAPRQSQKIHNLRSRCLVSNKMKNCNLFRASSPIYSTTVQQLVTVNSILALIEASKEKLEMRRDTIFKNAFASVL